MTSVPGLDRRVRALVVASVALYREGLCTSLAARAGFDVFGSPPSTADTRPIIASRKPDVVVIDAGSPRSFDIVQSIRVEAPSVKIVAFGIEDSEADIVACIEAGVHGYLLREASMDEFVHAIVAALHGEVQFPPRVAASVCQRLASLAASRDPLPGRWVSLTARERDVLTLLESGLTNKQIAQELRIEISTVKNHVHRVLEKLHVGSRAAAVATLHAGLVRRSSASLR